MASLRYALLFAAGCAPPPVAAPSAPPVVDTTVVEPADATLDADALFVGVLGRDPSAMPSPRGTFAQLPRGELVYVEKGGLVHGPLDGPVRRVSLGDAVAFRHLYGTPRADRVVMTGAEGDLELWSLDGERLKRWPFPDREHVLERPHLVAVDTGAFAVADRDGVTVYDADGEVRDRRALPKEERPQEMWLRGDSLWLRRHGRGLRRWDRDQPAPEVVVEGSDERYLRAAAVSADGTRWAYVREAETERRWEKKVEVVLAGREGIVARWEKERYFRVEELAIVGDNVVWSSGGGLMVHHVGEEKPRRLPGVSIPLEPRPPGPLVVGVDQGATTCDPATGTCRDEPGHHGAVRALEAVAGHVISAGADGRVLHWTLSASGAEPTTVFVADQPVAPRLAVNAQGLAVYGSMAATEDDEAALGITFFPWASQGLEPARWSTPYASFHAFGIDPAGWVVGVDRWGDVTLFDLATGKLGAKLPLGHPQGELDRPEQRVHLSPDGHGWWGSRKRLRWQLEGGVTEEIEVDEAPRGHCAWAPGGDLVCADRERSLDGGPLVVTTHLPTGASSRWEHSVGDASSQVTSVAIGEEVRVVALGEYEEETTLVCWRGGEARPLILPHPKVTAMTLLAGERRLVSGHEDGSLRLWQIP